MRTTDNQIDHTLLKKRGKEVIFRPWLKAVPPRFYLNLLHDPGYQLHELFKLTLVRDTNGTVLNAVYRGTPITVEERDNLISSTRVPSKVWVSGGRVHTDAYGLPLSAKDTEAIITLFKAWAAKVAKQTDVDIEFATAVSEELELLEANTP